MTGVIFLIVDPLPSYFLSPPLLSLLSSVPARLYASPPCLPLTFPHLISSILHFPFPLFLLPSLSLLLPCPYIPSSAFRSRPLKSARGSGERCELPQQGLGRKSNLVHLVLKSGSCCQQFLQCDAMRCTVFVIVILSVCLSVCHTRGLCPHGLTYDHDFFTVW